MSDNFGKLKLKFIKVLTFFNLDNEPKIANDIFVSRQRR
jgi:hypothetical protein